MTGDATATPTFWDRLQAPFSVDDVDRALVAAASIEDAAEGVLVDLGDAILRAAREHDERVATQLCLDGAVLTLEIASSAVAARWGQPFAPARVFDDHPFQVGDAPETVKDYLLRRAAETGRQDAAARYRDFIWTRWRHGPSLLPALMSYCTYSSAVDVNEIEAVMSAADGLARAARMAVEFNHRRTETAAAVRDALLRFTPYSVIVLELAQAAAGLLSIERDATQATAAELICDGRRGGRRRCSSPTPRSGRADLSNGGLR